MVLHGHTAQLMGLTELRAPPSGPLLALTLGMHWGKGLQDSWGGWQQSPWSLDTHVLLIVLLSQKSMRAGAASPWMLIIIPPIPRAPTHALLREKRKKKMRKGSWGTETDPKTTALLRSTRMTKAQTSVSSFDSEHRAGTEQGAADPGDQKGEGLKRCRQGTHVSPGQELRDCRDPSVVSCPCFHILHEY